MNTILTDFKTLFAIIKSDKNTLEHIEPLTNLVNNFERKYLCKYRVANHYLCLFLKSELEELKFKLNGSS